MTAFMRRSCSESAKSSSRSKRAQTRVGRAQTLRVRQIGHGESGKGLAVIALSLVTRDEVPQSSKLPLSSSFLQESIEDVAYGMCCHAQV